MNASNNNNNNNNNPHKLQEKQLSTTLGKRNGQR